MRFLSFAIAFWTSLGLCLPGNCNPFDYHKQSADFWKKKLSGETFRICQDKGTEKAGSGKYDKFYGEGTYYCACCGGDFPLFSSKNKFDSKTGWPSFSAPLDFKNIVFVKDKQILSRALEPIFGPTIEVQCARCGGHLGHVFDDGPAPTHKRYCLNSAALTFAREGETPTRTFEVP